MKAISKRFSLASSSSGANATDILVAALVSGLSEAPSSNPEQDAGTLGNDGIKNSENCADNAA
eukprot:4794158-Amphidinium_carterae.1